MITLRPYDRTDAESVTRWIKDSSALFLWAADRFREHPLSADTFDGIYTDKSLNGFIAEDDGLVMGHLFMQPHPDGRLKFGLIIVDPDVRGKGYGKKMLLSALEYAKKRYSPRSVFLCAFDTNQAAYNCYKSLGFAETGVVINHTFEGKTHFYREMEYAL